MVGAPLLGMYPVVPLLPASGSASRCSATTGKLCWGFNADYELVPDLRAFHDDVCAAFEQLRAAAVARYMQRRTASGAEIEAIAAPDEKRSRAGAAADVGRRSARRRGRSTS